MDTNGERGAVSRSQDAAHGSGHDYTVGSPHLRHRTLREKLDARITAVIAEVRQRRDHCDVLEIGAGHGSFTDTVLAAGGRATVTEMSKASHEFLSEKFRDRPEVQVIFDTDGRGPSRTGARYDVILLISVIHHIPDYMEAVTNLCDESLRPGGALITFQDPTWYPRQTRWGRSVSQGSYFAWRITQGEVKRGLATRVRRLRGVYDEKAPSDLVEYHVVRRGVDDYALNAALETRFRHVDVDRYFSTQSPIFQTIGENRFPHNTFGLVARGRLPD